MTLEHSALLRRAAWTYSILGGVGAAWMGLRDGWTALWPDLRIATSGGFLGIAGGLGVAALWRLLAPRVRALDRFESGMAIWFRGMSPSQVGCLALASGIGEELFFRGGMQGTLGLTGATLLFAAAHVPARRELALWPVFALLAGGLMGWLYAATATLFAPILCHFVINLVNLSHLAGAPIEEDHKHVDSHVGTPGTGL